MNPQAEVDPSQTPIGLYRDPESGREIGCTHEAQAAAAIRAGYKLVPGGDPYKSQEDMDADANPPEHDLPEGGETFDPEEEDAKSKKGSK